PKLWTLALAALFLLLLAAACAPPPMQSQARAYSERAIANLRAGDVDRALVAVEKALALEPDLPQALYARAAIYRVQKEYTAALADLKRVIDLAPEEIQGYMTLGLTYQELGDLPQSIATYEQALALDPENANIYNNICWAYGTFNQPEQGLEYCERAVELRADPYIHDSRGLVYALLGDYGNAIIDFTIYINAYERTNGGRPSASVELRKGWIKAMHRGENPFTQEVLEALR
ncbi:MAG: tetratricopeptide repeat protein, partial [Planctomycetaceae bacterium]